MVGAIGAVAGTVGVVLGTMAPFWALRRAGAAAGTSHGAPKPSKPPCVFTGSVDGG